MKYLDHSLIGVALDEFRDTILDRLGVVLSIIDHDGGIHRFGSKNEFWYKLHLDGCPAGAFGNWKQGIKQSWKFSGPRKTYTDAEKQAFKLRSIKEQEQRQKEIVLLRYQTGIRAQSNWSQYVPAPPDHPYLARKKVLAHNARFYNGSLVIPIYDRDKQLVNQQYINADGTKRFMKGGKLRGCFSVIGRTSDDPIGITEGWATGCSVHEKHGFQTFIAFSANNLEPVARTLRDLFPMRQLYVYGDNDISGVGQEAAQKAAIASKGIWVIPDIAGKDFNDIYSNNDATQVSQ